MDLMQQIDHWLIGRQLERWERSETATARVFGLVTLADGRRAQIQVKLEADEEEWV